MDIKYTPKTKWGEAQVEEYLREQCVKQRWLCEKFTSPQRRSVPDRVVTMPGRVIYVECKAPGKRPTDAQARDHKRREKLGHRVWVIDTKEKVDAFIGAYA